MTNALAEAVKKDLEDQLNAMGKMAEAIKSLSTLASEDHDRELQELVKTLASELRRASDKAVNVGEKVFDRAA